MVKEESCLPFSSFLSNRYWAQMVLASRNLARIIWIHTRERDGELGKEDVLAKLSPPHI